MKFPPSDMDGGSSLIIQLVSWVLNQGWFAIDVASVYFN